MTASKSAPPPRDFQLLANVVLATSEKTAQYQYTAVYASTKKPPPKSHS